VNDSDAGGLTGDWLDNCIVIVSPISVPGGEEAQLKIDAPCIHDGDMCIFMPVNMPKSVHVGPNRKEEDKGLMRNKRKPAAACEDAHLFAHDPNMGGAVKDGNLTVMLSEATYTMCLARKQDFEATNGGGFWYYYGAEPPHYAVLHVGPELGNIRTRPWEPHIDGKEETFEEDDCTVSDIFCKHNKSATNTTSTPWAGQVETGKPTVDLVAGEKSLGAAILGGDPLLNLSSAGGSRKSGQWRADGTSWSASAGSNAPPAPPPPPLKEGESWQEHECDVASWLCPSNRSSTGVANFGFGPGGISRWRTVANGTSTAVGIAWWWILVIFGILLCCLCCLFCFFGCQRRKDREATLEADLVTAPLSASRWSDGTRAQVGPSPEPKA
jgi:hypothetical protein